MWREHEYDGTETNRAPTPHPTSADRPRRLLKKRNQSVNMENPMGTQEEKLGIVFLNTVCLRIGAVDVDFETMSSTSDNHRHQTIRNSKIPLMLHLSLLNSRHQRPSKTQTPVTDPGVILGSGLQRPVLRKRDSHITCGGVRELQSVIRAASRDSFSLTPP